MSDFKIPKERENEVGRIDCEGGPVFLVPPDLLPIPAPPPKAEEKRERLAREYADRPNAVFTKQLEEMGLGHSDSEMGFLAGFDAGYAEGEAERENLRKGLRESLSGYTEDMGKLEAQLSEATQERERLLKELEIANTTLFEKDGKEEAEALKRKILGIIDRSGMEGIYNWGAPLREIRAALSPEAKEGKDA